MAKVEPWERQEGETPKAYEAFTVYRDMGIQRSVRKVARELSKSETLMARWSGAYDWVDRVAAWDSEQDRVARQQQLDDIKKMRKKHANIADAMLIKAAAALKRIPTDEIKATDISRMVDIASRLERISRGDTESILETRDGGESINPVQIYIPSNSRDGDDGFDDLEV